MTHDTNAVPTETEILERIQKFSKAKSPILPADAAEAVVSGWDRSEMDKESFRTAIELLVDLAKLQGQAKKTRKCIGDLFEGVSHEADFVEEAVSMALSDNTGVFDKALNRLLSAVLFNRNRDDFDKVYMRIKEDKSSNGVARFLKLHSDFTLQNFYRDIDQNSVDDYLVSVITDETAEGREAAYEALHTRAKESAASLAKLFTLSSHQGDRDAKRILLANYQAGKLLNNAKAGTDDWNRLKLLIDSEKAARAVVAFVRLDSSHCGEALYGLHARNCNVTGGVEYHQMVEDVLRRKWAYAVQATLDNPDIELPSYYYNIEAVQEKDIPVEDRLRVLSCVRAVPDTKEGHIPGYVSTEEKIAERIYRLDEKNHIVGVIPYLARQATVSSLGRAVERYKYAFLRGDEDIHREGRHSSEYLLAIIDGCRRYLRRSTGDLMYTNPVRLYLEEMLSSRSRARNAEKVEEAAIDVLVEHGLYGTLKYVCTPQVDAYDEVHKKRSDLIPVVVGTIIRHGQQTRGAYAALAELANLTEPTSDVRAGVAGYLAGIGSIDAVRELESLRGIDLLPYVQKLPDELALLSLRKAFNPDNALEVVRFALAKLSAARASGENNLSERFEAVNDNLLKLAEPKVVARQVDLGNLFVLVSVFEQAANEGGLDARQLLTTSLEIVRLEAQAKTARERWQHERENLGQKLG